MGAESPIPIPPEQQSSGQIAGQPTAPKPSEPSTEPTGRRASLSQIRRQLTAEELASPGVQKLLIEDLYRADDECERLQGYVDRFHDADKEAAILKERLRTVTAIEIMFGVGLTLGGVFLGLIQTYGTTAGILGAILIIGPSVARWVKR